MPPRRPAEALDQNVNRIIRFADELGLTFVNYNAANRSGFGYRQEARLHNAHRRSARRAGALGVRDTRRSSSEPRMEVTITRSTRLLDPLSTYGRDPFSQDVLIPSQNLETIWRSIFTDYFYLPPSSGLAADFPNPSDVFFRAARASQDLFRTLVVQAVITTEVGRGSQPDEAVFRNQALVIRDFRRLVDLYDSPSKRLTRKQFEHIFASAFSMSGHGFSQQAAYDAIVFTNSLFMLVPDNRTVPQTEVTDWIRMLMPHPGPTFNRTKVFQLEMLNKINLTFSFLKRMRDSVNSKFPPPIQRFVIPGTALYKVVTTKLPDPSLREPHPGFHSVCLHRLLALLYTYMEHLCNFQLSENNRLLTSLEASASKCIRYPPHQCITLFLWSLITRTVDTPLNNDVREQLFAWAMKDLWPMRLSFTDKMTAWLLQRCDPQNTAQPPTLDFTELRERMREIYDVDYARQASGP